MAPRLENSHTFVYLRRDQKQRLLGALRARLVDAPGATTLTAAWAAIEARDKRPLLVILDQAEELFTLVDSAWNEPTKPAASLLAHDTLAALGRHRLSGPSYPLSLLLGRRDSPAIHFSPASVV